MNEKCPICGRTCVEIIHRPNGDVEYVHGRYTTFTDYCRQIPEKEKDGES